MKRTIYSLSLFVILQLFWGCYPGGAEYTDELDIVATNYDKTYIFTSKKKYSLPDKIVKITGDLTAPPQYVKQTYADAILARIDANMAGLGWTKVDVADPDPHVQMLPAAWESTTIIYGGYWGGYWCWYYPYYCGGGGWYYPYPIYTSYTTGTLVVTMVDPDQESTDDSKRLAWTGAINGLLTGTFSPDRVNRSLDQLFIQSPYLDVAE